MKNISLKSISICVLMALTTTGCMPTGVDAPVAPREEITQAEFDEFVAYNNNASAPLIDLKFFHAMGAEPQGPIGSFIDAFELLFPRVDIQHSQIGGYTDLEKRVKLELLVGGNSVPDIIQAYPDHLANYMVSNKVIDISGYIKSEICGFGLKDCRTTAQKDPTSPEFDANNYAYEDLILSYRKELEEMIIPGTFGLPFNKSSEALVYNGKILEEVGFTIPTNNVWTWDDVEAASAKIRSVPKYAGDDFLPFAYDSISNLFITFGTQYGGIDSYTVQKDWGEKVASHVNFHKDKDFKKGIVRYLENVKQKYFDIPGYFENASYASDKFKEQKVALTISSTGGVRYNIPASGIADMKIGVAQMPQVAGAKNSEKSVMQQGTSLALLWKNTNDSQMDKMRRIASFLFVRFATNTQNAATFTMTTGYNPIRESTQEYAPYASFLQNSNTNNAFYYRAQSNLVSFEQNEFMHFNPAFVGSSTIRSEAEATMTDLVTNVRLGKIKDIEKAVNDELNNLYKRIQRL